MSSLNPQLTSLTLDSNGIDNVEAHTILAEGLPAALQYLRLEYNDFDDDESAVKLAHHLPATLEAERFQAAFPHVEVRWQ
ncbi:hypothetical protein H9P43_004048 [Blastocladiella emersonii ATCC 22665]|nr:hypothetical protein H9P43_004048 [Blastocladiella emersonii ATCC 22665]